MYNYCKTCCHDDGDIGFCDKCYYNHILEEKGIPPTEYEAKPKPQTNADKIRAMSDDELAEFMVKTIGNSFCPPSIAEDSIEEVCRGKSGGCMRCWLCWLKQEVESNDS